MNQTGKTVAKNASFLMASQLITWGLSLVTAVMLPRFLGTVAIGQFYIASSLWAIAGILVTFGMDTLLTKEIARNRDRLGELFGTSLILRGLLFVLVFAGVILYIQVANYDATTMLIIMVIGLGNPVQQIGFLTRASLEGVERMEFISLADIGSKAVFAFGTITMLLLGYGVYAIAAVVLITHVVLASIQLYNLRRVVPFAFRVDWSMMGQMLKTAVPYLLVSLFLVAYIQIDVIIISLLVDETAVGWYSTADQLFGTLLFVPTVFMTAVFPLLSRMYTSSSQEAINKVMSKSFDLSLWLGVPIGLGLVAIANPLVILLFGDEFANSGPILAILGIVLILTYQNTLVGKFLISMDRQNAWTKVMAIATVATIPLDLILVPFCQRTFGNGAMGGALAFVVTEGFMVLIGIRMLPKGTLTRKNGWRAARTLVAGVGMAAVVWSVRDLFILLPIFIGGVVYVSLLLLFRVVPTEDWLLLKQAAGQVTLRLRGKMGTA